MNTYRDITWRTITELSLKLGKNPSYVSGVLIRHPEMTIESVIDRVLGKEYRGIIWHNHVELSEALGLNKTYASAWFKRHPNKTENEFIDYILGKEYKGFTWRNKHQLSLALGEENASNVYRYFKENPEKTEEDYIDYKLSKGYPQKKKSFYKGITWSTKRDLSRQFGKCETYAGTWLCRNKDKTIYDLIDILLKEEKESA